MHQTNPQPIIALITGSNSGVGYAIAEQLLSLQPPYTVTVILGCRNKSRAIKAQSTLLEKFPSADIHILILDLTIPESILKAADQALASFPKITHLFCNAGILKTVSLSWRAIIRDSVWDPIDLFTLGTNAFVQPVGWVDHENRGRVFMANTAGHYILIRSLEPCLISGQARVIFTSSKSSLRQYFNPNDIQCRFGTHPYQSSKFALDALTLALNEKYHGNRITFHSFCPGTVYTGLVALPVPSLVVILVYHLLRVFISSMTITPRHGSTAALHLALTPLLPTLPPVKTMSRASPLGNSLIETIPLVQSTLACDLLSLKKFGLDVAKECDFIYRSVTALPSPIFEPGVQPYMLFEKTLLAPQL